MLKPIEGLPANVFGFEAVGKVTEADYKDVLVPAVKAQAAANDKLRFIYVFGDNFDDYSAGAMWEDLKLGVKEPRRWEKIAIVTDSDWMRRGITAFGWMMPGDVKIFSSKATDEAKRWVAE